MVNAWERRALQGIERDLRASDPSLARWLGGGSLPARRLSTLRLTWLLLATVPLLVGLLAVLSSHPLLGFVGFLTAVGTGCAYLVCVPRLVR